MDRKTLELLARTSFSYIYTSSEGVPQQYIDHCRAVKEGLVSDELAPFLLAHLEAYERAERLDFDDWFAGAKTRYQLIRYAVLKGRCDIIDKYVPKIPDPSWSVYVMTWYKPCLYPILHLVMPLPVTVYIALVYVRHGLHLEVATHIVGRRDHHTGELITPESLARCAKLYAEEPCVFERLEAIGLDPR